MWKKALSMLALFLLSTACGLAAGMLFGTQGGWPVMGVVACLLVALGLAWAARRLSAWVWIAAGLLLQAGLALPLPTVAEGFASRLSEPFASLLMGVDYWLPGVALIPAALLLNSGLALRQARKKAESLASYQRTSRRAAACFALSALLVAATFYTLFWLTVWDNTGDSAGYFLIGMPILAALVSGMILAINLKGGSKLAGLFYAFCLPVLLIAVSTLAQQVDFRQLTVARAERVSRAIEAYHAKEGRYPQDLRQLTPWTLLTIPGPVILEGQGWCYQAGADYYRLGYVNRLHWSDPRLIGQVFREAGAVPDLPGICQQEIEALIRTEPIFHTSAP